MELLSTEGQRKEEMIANRRANPNFPTAYEISRRNYVVLGLLRSKWKSAATRTRKLIRRVTAAKKAPVTRRDTTPSTP